jgi:predicted Abi (CAAX) family protease
MDLTNLFYNRIVSGLLSFPDLNSWLVTFFLLIAVSSICLSIGFNTGFLKNNLQTLPITKSFSILVISFFFPALAEETFFRVIMLPSKSENVPINFLLIWGVISLLAYVLFHPLNSITLYKKSFPIFTNPTFLSLTSILGLACTLSYFQSASVWNGVLIHWSIVVSWLLLLDGYTKLNRT